MKLVYFEPAKRDLERFRMFMLSNDIPPERVNHILSGMLDSIRTLESNPMLGYSIGAKHGYTTSHRAFITDPCIAIYKISGDEIEIRRIYHQREDYIRDILIME